jgi:HK97 family phage prohead protease
MSQRAKRIQSERFERTILELDRKGVREEDRTVPAALSSESEVERWFGREVLVHEESAIDFSRVESLGLPLLWMHNHEQPIGRIEGLRLDPDRILRGTLRFSDNPKASEIWADVRGGFLNAVSIGYKVHKWEETKDSDLVRITRWMPIEASVVSVPADASVGLNRSEDQTMADEGNGHTTERQGGGEPVALEQYRAQFDAGKKAGTREVKERERQRIGEIGEIFANPLVPRDDFYRSLKTTAIEREWSVDKTRKTVMDALAGELPEDFEPAEPEVTGLRRLESVALQAMGARQSTPDLSRITDQQLGVGRRGTAQAGADAIDKFVEIAADALFVRSGLCTDPEMQKRVNASSYRERSLSRLAQEYLTLRNVDTRPLDDKQIARQVLTREGPHTGSDFSSILANVATKSVMAGWQAAGTTWQAWCSTGSLPDFKASTIAGLGGYPDLDKIPRSGGPYKQKSMDDIHETAQLDTYGALFGIGRQAIIDDDLGAFTDIPRQMGIAAGDKVDQLAYNELITSNGSTPSVTGRVLTQDSTALFDSTHSNYIASSSGAAPSVLTLNTAEAAMMRQKQVLPSGDGSLRYIAVSPAVLLVPPELKATGSTLIAAQWDPAGTTASKSVRDAPNPWQDRLSVVASPLLTLTTGWYLLAAPNGRVATVRVFFLNGQQTPYLEQMDQGTADGVTWKVRIDAVARALDFRGVYFNYGV